MIKEKLRAILTSLGLCWKKPTYLTIDDWDVYDANRKWLEKAVDFIFINVILYRIHAIFCLLPRKTLENTKQFFIWGWRMRGYRPWDYTFLYQTLGYCFNDMEEYARLHGHLRESPKQAKEYRTCAELCKRISSSEDYNIDCRDRADFFAGDRPKHYSPGFRGQVQKNQLEILTTLMKRKSLGWWD